MKRGDIYLVDYEPARGSETNKARPAVVVSNDAANAAVARTGLGVVTLVPLTSNTSRVYPFQVLLSAEECGLPKDSKVQCEQLRALAPERLLRAIGSVPRQRMAEIDVALRRHLAL
ncbi:type II toxin-antitoxin system PemK/MazF family toxin [Streptomyces sp. WI04-05B]|uniref:type II toxin-antitoxin system PemK/MazF family toxin n=1 Tax=Streptomyces TaxID=1883 RepID=UPI0029B1F37F|nr:MULTISPECIES: type II toxin-antitoxin system PemK/MazF family toxin [unclassified Streptomyces]MDX2545472.1 type II toxin-antitoxin system PemK/MazF family toxin [Streptomyces sp. WI04-05B]MDX2581859.1 type II toxin-antitoxin system PemK/MazF family toxin [Streptomyces sp. WI04-05A]MDX3753520.1 type II toxin-antitoxin system PemK/MazF family toxin [Streptomyces sp. AK08-02]